MAGTEAPSIGSVELRYDERGNRVRRIVPFEVTDFSVLLPELNQAQMLAEQCGATRRLVRAVVDNQVINQITGDLADLGWSTEAIVNLSGRLNRTSLVYFGRNDLSRASCAQVLDQERRLLNGVLNKSAKSPQTVMQKARDLGFTLERLRSPLTEEDKQRLFQMYKMSFTSYPFNVETAIIGMVDSPNTHVYAARSMSDGLLYAVSATELVTVPGVNLTMREMGDSAKMPEVNGLNAPLKLMLAYEAYTGNPNLDLLFCETRAALGAVNAVNHSIGMRYSGLLPKHTVISGSEDVSEVALDGENGQYGNMNVWAFNNDALRNIAQQVHQTLQ